MAYFEIRKPPFLARLLLASLVLAGMASCSKVHTTQAILGPKGVASLEYIELGGQRQLVLIRGEDVSKPILLYIHGGPGVPAIPYEHAVRGLEKDFIVVFYDQRGVGRSDPKKVEENATIDRYVLDARELIDILLRRFGKDKLYVLGHSWGSILGLRLAGEIPGKLHAYIGMGQLVSGLRNETRSYEWALEAARKAGNTRAAKDLESLKPPYLDPEGRQIISALAAERKWLEKLGGVYYDYRKLGNSAVISTMLKSTEYFLLDFLGLEKRGRGAARVVWKEQMEVDFFASLPRVDVPLYLFMGAADMNTPVDLAREYFDRVEAPMGKTFILFEKSGHFPLFEEKDHFYSVLRRVAAECGTD